MRGTSDETNMMHRQQRLSSSFLRSNSSRGSNECRKIVSSSSSNASSNNNNNTSNNNNNNNNNVISSLSNDCTSPLSILSRRCSYNRSRTSTTVTTTSTPSSRCSTSASTSTASTCPVLLSVLAWSVTLLLISSCLGIADAGVLMGHPLGKRSFMQLQCKGIYDKSIFARLDRICEDCYNLFREPTLHTLCRKNCFTSDYFKGCLDVLLLQDEVEQIQTWIKQLHGADPGV